MKQKKKLRLLIILLLVILLAAAAYWRLASWNSMRGSEYQDEGQIKLTEEDFDSSDLNKITCVKDKETLTFIKDDNDAWHYEKDQEFPLDQSRIQTLTSALRDLLAVRRIQDNLDQLEKFGLDSPTLTVTAQDGGNHTVTLYLGDVNESAGGSYAYVEGDSHVYTVPSSFAQTFDVKLNDLIAQEEPPKFSAENISEITLTRKDGVWNMIYIKEGDSSLDYTNTMRWFLTDPKGRRSPMDTEKSRSLTSYLSALTPDGCAAYNVSQKELADYGLDTPAAAAVVRYGNDNLFQFEVGAKADDNHYYMTWEGSRQISLLDAQTAEYLLELNGDTYATLQPCNIDAGYVRQLSMTAGKSTRKISPNDSKKLYGQIQSLTGETLYPEKPSPDKSVKGTKVSLNFSLKGLKTSSVTFDLSPYNSSYYTLSINKKPYCLVNKMDVLALLDNF